MGQGHYVSPSINSRKDESTPVADARDTVAKICFNVFEVEEYPVDRMCRFVHRLLCNE